MPIPILGEIVFKGFDSVPHAWTALSLLPWAFAVYALRWFFAGTTNTFDRVMHGRVALVTGGTAGLGEAVVNDLASKGCQVILLVRSIQDGWLHEYISDLRERHNNELIYAEECDLSSLHSIRVFCTRWLDNAPPRRLDVIVLAAGLMSPPFTSRTSTKDGIESHWGINFLANFHLLTLLEPVIKVQPPDRDVRIVVATCSSYILGDLDLNDTEFVARGYPSRRPWQVYGASKIALMSFAVEFQRRLNAYERPDKALNNARIYTIDPGLLRSPGTRRWISLGRILGLLFYLITWPIWFITLKNPVEGAQSFFSALYSPDFARGEGGGMIRECKPAIYRNEAITSPVLGEQIYEVSQAQIEFIEKAAALQRAKDKAAKVEKGKTSSSATTTTTISDDKSSTTTTKTKTKTSTKPDAKTTLNEIEKRIEELDDEKIVQVSTASTTATAKDHLTPKKTRSKRI